MEYSKLRIKLEELLSGDLYELMEGNVVEAIIAEAKIDKIENEWK